MKCHGEVFGIYKMVFFFWGGGLVPAQFCSAPKKKYCTMKESAEALDGQGLLVTLWKKKEETLFSTMVALQTVTVTFCLIRNYIQSE